MMTEEKIELEVEHMMDQLDRMLMDHRIDQQTYDLEVKHIDLWAVRQYDKLDSRK